MRKHIFIILTALLIIMPYSLWANNNITINSISRNILTYNPNDTIVVNKDDLINVLKNFAEKELEKHLIKKQQYAKRFAIKNQDNAYTLIPIYYPQTQRIEYMPLALPNAKQNEAIDIAKQNGAMQLQINKLQEQIDVLSKLIKDSTQHEILSDLKKQNDLLKNNITIQKGNKANLTSKNNADNKNNTNLVSEEKTEKTRITFNPNLIKEDSKLIGFSNFKRQIFFNISSADFTDEALETLKEVTSLLIKNPTIKINLTGYASKDGNTNYNKKLAMQRQAAAKKYLLQAGVNKKQIQCEKCKIDATANLKTYARRVDMKIYL